MSESHLERYKEENTGKYNGVHLYGRTGCRDYTNSVNTIMMLAKEGQNNAASYESGRAQSEDHTNCPQAKYQRRFQPSISTSNRFSVLNSNLGNF